MKEFLTVIFPMDLNNGLYYIGDVDESGKIVTMSDFIQTEGSPLSKAENLACLVYASIDDEDQLEIKTVQQYSMFSKVDDAAISFSSLIEGGQFDPVEATNAIVSGYATDRRN